MGGVGKRREEEWRCGDEEIGVAWVCQGLGGGWVSGMGGWRGWMSGGETHLYVCEGQNDRDILGMPCVSCVVCLFFVC